MNKLYSVHDHWTNINKKNDVDIESIDGVITGIKVNGEDYGGGGGSSDFSTAEVTIQITTAQPNVAIYIPTIISSPMEAIFNNPYNPANSSTPQTITVPLYKGSLIINGIWDSGDVNANISGSVQVMESSFLVTGDCTITIS